MPRKTSSKAKAKPNKLSGESDLIIDEQILRVEKKDFLRTKRTPLIIVLVLVILALGGFFFKEKFVVAVVNGKPIFRYHLNQKLVSSFGKETLENLIVEELIKEEVKKNKVTVSEKEVDEEMAKLAKNLGEGTKIEDVLKLQGISLKDFRRQLKMRLEVNKILEKEISISDDEINAFIKDNSQAITATGEAERKAQAREILKDQQLSQKIQKWVSDLLAKGKITRFLK